MTMDRAILTRTSSGYSSLKRATSSETVVKMPSTTLHRVKTSNKSPPLFLIYLLFISTLGPLQFGYHLVSLHVTFGRRGQIH